MREGECQCADEIFHDTEHQLAREASYHVGNLFFLSNPAGELLIDGPTMANSHETDTASHAGQGCRRYESGARETSRGRQARDAVRMEQVVEPRGHAVMQV